MLLQGKRILITGGTGSFGQVFLRRAINGDLGVPKKAIVFSRDEAKQYDMKVAYARDVREGIRDTDVMKRLEFRIADVLNYSDVCAALRDVDIVIHTAALKQVPTCEYYPEKAIETNCLGASNIVRALREHGYSVETVLTVSTDKACLPGNTMGMTKALQERIMISANILTPATRFIAIRCGNVLASRGSVIPLFRKQIHDGGPVTVTSPDMTRFFMSLDQGVETIVAALRGAKRGEIFVPKAKSASIKNIAKALIGNQPIEIKFIGVRPGERMHEPLISDSEAQHTTRRGDYFSIKPILPELASREDESEETLGVAYTSETDVLDLDGTAKLLCEHGLMPDYQYVQTKAGRTAAKRSARVVELPKFGARQSSRG